MEVGDPDSNEIDGNIPRGARAFAVQLADNTSLCLTTVDPTLNPTVVPRNNFDVVREVLWISPCGITQESAQQTWMFQGFKIKQQ